MDVFPDLFVRVQSWYSGAPDPLVAALAPDVSWSDASGRLEGREPVADHLRTAWANDELRPDDLHVLPDGLLVRLVVDVHRTVRDDRGVVRAEADERHHLRLDSTGLVVEFRVSYGRPGTR